MKLFRKLIFCFVTLCLLMAMCLSFGSSAIKDNELEPIICNATVLCRISGEFFFVSTSSVDDAMEIAFTHRETDTE